MEEEYIPLDIDFFNKIIDSAYDDETLSLPPLVQQKNLRPITINQPSIQVIPTTNILPNQPIWEEPYQNALQNLINIYLKKNTEVCKKYDIFKEYVGSQYIHFQIIPTIWNSCPIKDMIGKCAYISYIPKDLKKCQFSLYVHQYSLFHTQEVLPVSHSLPKLFESILKHLNNSEMRDLLQREFNKLNKKRIGSENRIRFNTFSFFNPYNQAWQTLQTLFLPCFRATNLIKSTKEKLADRTVKDNNTEEIYKDPTAAIMNELTKVYQYYKNDNTSSSIETFQNIKKKRNREYNTNNNSKAMKVKILESNQPLFL